MSIIETVSIDEASEQLGLKRRTLYGYLKAGQLRGTKVGRRWRITAESISELLEQGRLQAEGAAAKRVKR